MEDPTFTEVLANITAIISGFGLMAFIGWAATSGLAARLYSRFLRSSR